MILFHLECGCWPYYRRFRYAMVSFSKWRKKRRNVLLKNSLMIRYYMENIQHNWKRKILMFIKRQPLGWVCMLKSKIQRKRFKIRNCWSLTDSIFRLSWHVITGQKVDLLSHLICLANTQSVFTQIQPNGRSWLAKKWYIAIFAAWTYFISRKSISNFMLAPRRIIKKSHRKRN